MSMKIKLILIANGYKNTVNGGQYMDLSDYLPTLRNDISIEDKNLYDEHSNLIKSKKYIEAVDLLKSNSQIDSLTASLLNLWEKKIFTLNNTERAFYDPYLYSQTEPIDMEGKVVWEEEY